jgi:hypothetical protein
LEPYARLIAIRELGLDMAFGGAVPEPSTWAMSFLGFAGLGLAGYRRAREVAPGPDGLSKIRAAS